MTTFSKRAAERLVARLELRKANRALAEHWLSLWNGDALPARTQLKPANLKSYLPGLMLFDTVPDKSVTVRLVGTNIVRQLKMELTGRDWVALAPKSYRAERLRIFSELARGALGIGHRRVPLTFGRHQVSQEILLPFAAEPDGVCPVLAYLEADLDPHVEISPVDEAMGSPIEFQLVALPQLTMSA